MSRYRYTWEELTVEQRAQLVTAASQARLDAIDQHDPCKGQPLNTLPAITEAVVRAFCSMVGGV